MTKALSRKGGFLPVFIGCIDDTARAIPRVKSFDIAYDPKQELDNELGNPQRIRTYDTPEVTVKMTMDSFGSRLIPALMKRTIPETAGQTFVPADWANGLVDMWQTVRNTDGTVSHNYYLEDMTAARVSYSFDVAGKASEEWTFTGEKARIFQKSAAHIVENKGTGDGIKTAFTLTQTPTAVDGKTMLKVTIDDVVKTEGTHFTVTGTTLTFTTAPANAAKILMRYCAAAGQAFPAPDTTSPYGIKRGQLTLTLVSPSATNTTAFRIQRCSVDVDLSRDKRYELGNAFAYENALPAEVPIGVDLELDMSDPEVLALLGGYAPATAPEVRLATAMGATTALYDLVVREYNNTALTTLLRTLTGFDLRPARYGATAGAGDRAAENFAFEATTFSIVA